MPQTLSNMGAAAKDATLYIGISATKQFPELALLVMRVIEIWSSNDSNVLRIFAQCLKSDMVMATDILLPIKNQDTQRLVVTAAAKHVLSRDDGILFQAAIMATKASRDVRNSFAHHIWAKSDAIPDAVLLVDPRHINGRVAEVMAQQLAGVQLTKEDFWFDHSQIYVYKKNDLELEVERALQARDIVSSLGILVSPTTKQIAEDRRRKLLENPVIRSRVESLSKETST